VIDRRRRSNENARVLEAQESIEMHSDSSIWGFHNSSFFFFGFALTGIIDSNECLRRIE
jgi:hypothetical protein